MSISMRTGDLKIKSFTDLIAWQKAHTIVPSIYCITKGFRTGIDKNRFYAMANGSVFETQSQLVLAKDLGYLPEKEFDILFKDLEEVSRLTSGLMRSSPDRVSHS